MIDFKFFDIYVINAIVTLVYFSSSYGYNRVLSLSIDLVRIQSSLSKDFSRKKMFQMAKPRFNPNFSNKIFYDWRVPTQLIVERLTFYRIDLFFYGKSIFVFYLWKSDLKTFFCFFGKLFMFLIIRNKNQWQSPPNLLLCGFFNLNWSQYLNFKVKKE